jgi:hypothetical protein
MADLKDGAGSMTEDILSRAEPFLNPCGSCDAGMPMSCTCPTGDYRPVMLDLVREVERLRAKQTAGPKPPPDTSWVQMTERRRI